MLNVVGKILRDVRLIGKTLVDDRTILGDDKGLKKHQQ
jgi:hypothetical protein